MSTDLSILMVEQTNTIALLKRVLINFKKLPKANVTVARTQGRLSDLKELWTKVQTLNTGSTAWPLQTRSGTTPTLSTTSSTRLRTSTLKPLTISTT
ncbi:hypothetical protein DMN91_005525 [Ooceraea biroi]|uniref:Uncharacterized protein n=1 Tax=Ooceraea biroi TaxID=2015173 RepID=A0A3L8DLT6_OOCBI|nr:hypothetical protein DMN91_005525 [Ooceraea biroi]